MIYKRIAPVISLLLLGCIFLYGCNMTAVIQPSREDIVGANSCMLAGPLQLKLDMKLMSDTGTILYYSSDVTAFQEDAIWDGVGKVYFGNMYFRQDCQTVCTESGSRKQWRGSWAASDTRSPVTPIAEWLGKAVAEGVYFTTPVTPSECSDYLEEYQDPAYRITWTEKDPQWDALCDVHPDTLFGGNDLITSFKEVKVTLFFGTDDLLLDVILLTAEEQDGHWLNFSIIPGAATEAPDTQWDGEVEQNIVHGEEWELIYSYTTGEEMDPTE